jgi:hypothetical protein
MNTELRLLFKALAKDVNALLYEQQASGGLKQVNGAFFEAKYGKPIAKAMADGDVIYKDDSSGLSLPDGPMPYGSTSQAGDPDDNTCAMCGRSCDCAPDNIAMAAKISRYEKAAGETSDPELRAGYLMILNKMRR